MGLKKIKKPNGEVYYVDERGNRIFSDSLDNLSETKLRNTSDEELQKKILLTTESNPTNLDIAERLDVISAECIFSTNLFEDFFDSGDHDTRSGTKSARDAFRNARHNVLRDLRREALNLTADAVVGVNLSYSEFYNKRKSMILLFATGTAVKTK